MILIDRPKLERQFTAMLVHSDTADAYYNLTSAYLTYDVMCRLRSAKQRDAILSELRNGDPKEWISKIFTEGLDTPPALYKINIYWLKHLEDLKWE